MNEIIIILSETEKNDHYNPQLAGNVEMVAGITSRNTISNTAAGKDAFLIQAVGILAVAIMSK